MAAICFYFGELSRGTEMHIATWLVAVPWRNSFIGAFPGEFQNLRSDASSGKRTSAVRAPTGQLPSMTSLASNHIKHFAAVFGDHCARVRHVGQELLHVMDDDLSDQIRCHRFYVSSQEELILCGWSPQDVVIVCAK